MADERAIQHVVAASIKQRLQAAGGPAQVVDGDNARGRGDCIGAFGHAWLSLMRYGRRAAECAVAVSCSLMASTLLDPIDLTRRLVNIESTTYHEGAAGAFLAEFLAGQRWAVEKMAVAQPDAKLAPGAGSAARFNVYAAMPGVTPDVVLSTHLDTVPPFFGCTEDDEFLYGRGTCDAKGILAAQVAAADKAARCGRQGWDAFCGGRGARLRRGEGGECEPARLALSDQR
jgi:hypothetical protein